MLKIVRLVLLAVLILPGCSRRPDPLTENKSASGKGSSSFCDDSCMSKSTSGELSCKMTSAELQQRRETVIASLKKHVTEKKELKDGYAFKFPGSDAMIDELMEFIKTERECCSFFTFNLSVSGDKNEAWLELSGQDGVKDFITAELGL